MNFHWGDLRLFLHWRLVGNCFSDKSQVLFSGSNNFGQVYNWNWDSSFNTESGFVGDVFDGLDLSVGVNVVIVAGHSFSSLLLFTGRAGFGVAELLKNGS